MGGQRGRGCAIRVAGARGRSFAFWVLSATFLWLSTATIAESNEITAATRTPKSESDGGFRLLKSPDLWAIEGITRSPGNYLATAETPMPAHTGSTVPLLSAKGSVASRSLANRNELGRKTLHGAEGNPYMALNTPQMTTSHAAHVSTPEAEFANSRQSMTITGDADASNARGVSVVDASQPHRSLEKENDTVSDGVPKKRSNGGDDAIPTIELGSEVSNAPHPERTHGNKPPPTQANDGVFAPSNINDYYVAVVLLASIVVLARLPSGDTARRASDERAPDTEPIVGTAHANVYQDPDARHKVDSEMGEDEPTTDSVARTSAPKGMGLSSKMLFILNFVLWVSLAMGFSAYAKGYLRETREPIGLVVLQGTTGIAVLGTLGRFRKIDLYPKEGYSTAAARRVGLAAVMHTAQALLTNYAVILGGVAATNALKAMEPIAAAAFSYVLLGNSCSAPRLASIFVIALGIIVFTVTSSGAGGGGGGRGGEVELGGRGGEEGDFSNRAIVGISTFIVVVAVCCNALRNVFIKQGDPIPPNQTLFACSVVAAVVGIGMAFLRLMFSVMDDLALVGAGQGEITDGSNNASRSTSTSNGGVDWLRVAGVNASLCFVGYNFASFNLLACLTPVGHAVGNSFKRVLVFAGGLVFLGEFMNSRQLGGAALALAGVLAYNVSGVKR